MEKQGALIANKNYVTWINDYDDDDDSEEEVCDSDEIPI